MKKVGIVAALRPEIACMLNNSFFGWEKIEENTYKSKNKDIFVTISGIGKALAAYGLGKIIKYIDTVITMGTSGGLGDEKIGSIYLSYEFVEHDMDASGLGFEKGITPFSKIQQVVIKNYKQSQINIVKEICQDLSIELNYGRTISGDQFLADQVLSKSKKDMFGGNLVDMESAAIAKICMLENKHVLGLRYITDNANHTSKIDWTENVKRSASIFNSFVEKLSIFLEPRSR
jgi:adenosylhomocysteine nucleosidase